MSRKDFQLLCVRHHNLGDGIYAQVSTTDND